MQRVLDPTRRGPAFPCSILTVRVVSSCEELNQVGFVCQEVEQIYQVTEGGRARL